jgi:hypothetical protein
MDLHSLSRERLGERLCVHLDRLARSTWMVLVKG